MHAFVDCTVQLLGLFVAEVVEDIGVVLVPRAVGVIVSDGVVTECNDDIHLFGIECDVASATDGLLNVVLVWVVAH